MRRTTEAKGQSLVTLMPMRPASYHVSVAILCAVIGAAVFGASPAAACSIATSPVIAPGPGEAPPAKYDEARQDIAESALTITGRVTKVRYLEYTKNGSFYGPHNRPYEATLRVSRIYKGMTGPTARVRGATSGATCGFGKLTVGQRLGLLLHGKRSPWGISITSRISYILLERATGGRSYRPHASA